MKICLAVYNNRLATLFDNAPQLNMYEYKGNYIHPAGEITIAQIGVSARIASMKASGVDLLLCGALSGYVKQMILDSGIEVLDWLRGGEKEILYAWQMNSLNEFTMPGCPRKKNCLRHGPKKEQ